MKIPGIGNKIKESLKNSAATILESSKNIAQVSVSAVNSARDSEVFKKAEDLTKNTLNQVRNSQVAQDLQQQVSRTVTHLRESETVRQIESVTTETIEATKQKMAALTDKLAYGDDAEWVSFVRTYLSGLSESDGAVFLRSLQPEALVKAMYCEDAIAIVKNDQNKIDLTDADMLYPGVIRTIAGHTILDSDNIDIANAMKQLQRVELRPASVTPEYN